jgi:hypothetical protein
VIAKEGAMNQKPVALGLHLCEQVIVEEKARNVTLVNCFTHRCVQLFPSEPITFHVVATLTDGIGEIPPELALQRLDTFEEIYRRSFSVRLANPLEEVQCIVRLRNHSFPVAGRYQAILLTGEDGLAQRTIRINFKG